jgi:hypothetical protein
MVLQVGQIFGTPVFRGNPTFRHRLHERRRLEYLRIGDVGVLTQPIGDIDPSKECGAELRDLKLATNLQRRYELSRNSWYNCLASVWNRTSRAYPNADWQSFLANYRITEKFSYKSVD